MAIAEELKLVVKAEVGNAIANMQKFSGATKKSESTISSHNNKVLNWIKGIAAAYLSVQTLRKALTFANEAAQIAADASQIKRALDSMAAASGMTANEIVANLKMASGGTIAELDLMRSASKAALFDLPMDKLKQLMEIARASATATGESVQFMFDSIVTGIARGSPMILDNLGLTIKIEEATSKYAKSIGKTSEELSAEERKMATLNAVLAAGGSIMERVGDAAKDFTDAERMQKFQAAIKDLKMEVGESLLPAFRGVLDVATSFIEKVKGPLAQAVANFPEIARIAFSGALDVLRIFFSPSNLWDTLKGLAIALVKTLEVAWNNLPRIAWDRIKLLATPFQFIAESLVNVFDSAWSRIRNMGAEAINNTLGKVFKFSIGKVEVPNLLEDLDATYQKFIDRSLDRTKSLAEGIGKALKDELAVLKDFGEALGNTAAGQRVQEIVAQIKALIQTSEEAVGGQENLAVAITKTGTVTGKTAKDIEDLKTRVQNFSDVAMALGSDMGAVFAEIIKGSGDAGEAFRNAMKNAIASVIEMFAKQWATLGIGMFIPGPTFNPVAGAGYIAAAAGAMVAAGAVRAMAEGGIVTKPTTALIGEAGPEAVIPLNKMGGMGNLTIVINGSVMEEEGIARRIGAVLARQRRGW